MKTFRELFVWQKSMNLVTKVYEITKEFPKTESFGLTSQMRRSAISVPSNIAEGYGREGLKEFIRFLNISLSSLFELQTQIEISKDLKYLNQSRYDVLFELSREVERMLSSFIRSLKSKK